MPAWPHSARTARWTLMRSHDTYLHIHRQNRSAWTWEVELRPWVERF